MGVIFLPLKAPTNPPLPIRRGLLALRVKVGSAVIGPFNLHSPDDAPISATAAAIQI
jgi:hypothetical protein